MDKFLIKKPPTSDEASLTDRIHRHLSKKFGLESFRGDQEAIIKTTLQGHDAFVLMPTGGGKSLTYQLPAIMSHGVTLVVSPLIALIQNQTDALIRLGVKAASLNSALKKSEKERVLKDLESASPSIKLLYVTPELLATPNFRELMAKVHKANAFARLVIDEAHCISEWGHDFRDDYRKLSYWKQEYSQVPIMALTATANASVRKDILKQLQIDTMHIFIGSFNRPNLFYEVRYKDPETNDPFDNMMQFLKSAYEARRVRLLKIKSKQRTEGICGIIYCATRKVCEEVAERLCENNVRAKCYHGGLTPKTRKSILQAWSGTTPYQITNTETNGPSTKCNGKAHEQPDEIIDVVVATISFGMGIDKKNVRFVIHWDMPKSFEGYYQESGRAGRDGKVSRCILYYSKKDGERAAFLVKQGAGYENDDSSSPRNDNALQSCQKLISYCHNYKTCRHKLIADYFDDVQDTPRRKKAKEKEELCPDSRCDVCQDPEKVKCMVKEGLSIQKREISVPLSFTEHERHKGYQPYANVTEPLSDSIQKFGGFRSASEIRDEFNKPRRKRLHTLNVK